MIPFKDIEKFFNDEAIRLNYKCIFHKAMSEVCKSYELYDSLPYYSLESGHEYEDAISITSKTAIAACNASIAAYLASKAVREALLTMDTLALT